MRIARSLGAALLATAALASVAVFAQPVAKLEVVKAAKPLTIHQKLDLILERLPAKPTAPVEAPPVATPTAPPATTPPAPAPPNPFLAYRAEGFTDLVSVVVWRLGGRSLTDAEIEQARAAGFYIPAPAAPSTGGPGFPPGFDLTGTEGGGGVRNPLAGGIEYTFTWRADRSGPAQWTFEINPGPMTATRVRLNGEWRPDLHDWASVPFVAVEGQVHKLTVELDGQATVGITVRHR